ncbi:hypothetical protein ACSHT0_11130 [Tepidicaulis sp. LMO-SS28]|uniref:hypothetical protein n=1 Tax=Tepidicaulis sp. LMO-SS28 TaxID=3447455 RepID=UPI003EE20741
MGDFVLTGVAMAVAVAAYKLWENVRAARLARRRTPRPAEYRAGEPKDLGRLRRLDDGTYVPE